MDCILLQYRRDLSDKSELISIFENRDSFVRQEFPNPVELLNFSLENGELTFGGEPGPKKLIISHINGKKKAKKKRASKNSERNRLIGSSLIDGFENYEQSDLNSVYLLELLFKSIYECYFAISGCLLLLLESLKNNVMTLRRILLLLMLLPLSPRRDISFNIIYFKGILVIDYDPMSNQGNTNSKYESRRVGKCIYAGHYFENLITTSPRKKDGGFYSLIEQEMFDFRLLFTSEVDSCVPGETGLASYVEIKTHAKCSENDQFFLKKLLKSWCQMKLADTKNLVIGFRSEDFRLASIKQYKTCDIPNKLHQHAMNHPDKSFYTCNDLLNRLHELLRWMNSEVRANANPDEVSLFSLRHSWRNDDQKAEICLERMGKQDTDRVSKRIIPNWLWNLE